MSSSGKGDGAVIERPLSLHERFAHMYAIIGNARTITFLYRYPSSELPTIEALHERVGQLQRDVEHFSSEIIDGNTNRPRMRLRHESWPGSEIVRDDTYCPSPGLGPGAGAWDLREAEKDGYAGLESQLLEQEIERMKLRVGAVGPAWQVTRYIPVLPATHNASSAPSRSHTSHPVGQISDHTAVNPESSANSIYADPDFAIAMHREKLSHVEDVPSQCDTAPSSPVASTEGHTDSPRALWSHQPSYIAISAYHHLVDGSAGLALANALLSPQGSTFDLAPCPGLAARMEDLVDMSPSPLFATREAFLELVVARLPRRLRNKLEDTPCWPRSAIAGHAAQFPEAQISLTLPSSWISKLKSIGKVNGVRTLHPILQTAFTFALWEEMGRPTAPIDITTPHNCRKDRDVKRPELLPKAGGVFVSVFHKMYDLHRESKNAAERIQNTDLQAAGDRRSIRKRGGDGVGSRKVKWKWPLGRKGISATSQSPGAVDVIHTPIAAAVFWKLARELSAQLDDPRAARKARYAVGMMAYLPDSDSFVSPHADKYYRRTLTQWEDFFWRYSESENPYRSSATFSNLGYTGLPPGCKGMRWAQSAVPFEQPIVVSLIGHTEGIQVTVGFRDGCVVSSADVRKILERFQGELKELLA